MKPVPPTSLWHDLIFIVVSSAILLIGLTIFQSCGGVEASVGNNAETRIRAEANYLGWLREDQSMSSDVVAGANPAPRQAETGERNGTTQDPATSDRPARLEPLPRIHLRPGPQDLRPVESAELVTL